MIEFNSIVRILDDQTWITWRVSDCSEPLRPRHQFGAGEWQGTFLHSCLAFLPQHLIALFLVMGLHCSLYGHVGALLNGRLPAFPARILPGNLVALLFGNLLGDLPGHLVTLLLGLVVASCIATCLATCLEICLHSSLGTFLGTSLGAVWHS